MNLRHVSLSDTPARSYSGTFCKVEQISGGPTIVRKYFEVRFEHNILSMILASVGPASQQDDRRCGAEIERGCSLRGNNFGMHQTKHQQRLPASRNSTSRNVDGDTAIGRGQSANWA